MSIPHLLKTHSLAALAALCLHAGSVSVLADTQASFYPISPEWNGGFASYGGTKLQVNKEAGVVDVSGSNGIGFVRWFVAHKPLPKTQLAEWAGGELRLEVKSVLGAITTEASAAWRGRVDPAELGTAVKEKIEIGDDWTKVSLPLPDADSIEGNGVTGILIKFAKGGEFQIRNIEVVASGSPQAAAAPAAPTPTPAPVAPKLSEQRPDVATVKVDKSGQADPAFISAHERNVARAKKGDVGVLFLGDSITANWGKFKPLWEKFFGAYQPANFGIGGDCTQHVLWRIENGELEGITPKVVVLMIGTNNTNYHDPESTARGVKNIVDTIREKLPASKILLLGAFPRGEKPNPYRAKNEKMNAIIETYADNDMIFYLDIGDKFLQPDGTITKEMMPDFLHLSEPAYQIWGDAITPKLTELMN